MASKSFTTATSEPRCSHSACESIGQLDSVILGTDAPAGSGVQPLGILRLISMLCSLGGIPAENAFCFATGNTAKLRKLDCGMIEAGRAADFVFMDRAQHSAGTTILESVLWVTSRRRHGRDRWRGALRAQPQHSPCGSSAKNC